MELMPIIAGASAWIWENYGKAITDKALVLGKEKWEKVNWQRAAAAYRQRIRDFYGVMRVMGMPKPIPLENIYTDVYILDRLTVQRRFDLQKLKQDPSKMEGKRISALRIAVKSDRLFILGKPGSGKTTFLKFLALKAAEERIDKIPIFVSLKEWSDSGLGLMPYLARQFDICSFPEADAFIERILQDGRALVLFDGLDEVNRENERRSRIASEIDGFVKKFFGNQFIVSCRSVVSDYSFEQFTYVEIAEFSEGQIRNFVGKWFSNNPIKHDKFLRDYYDKENRGLRELAHTPLLLLLLCLAFDETMAFPRRRVEIYEDALDALLKKWDTSRNIKRDDPYHSLSLGRKRQMFARIAAETFEKGDYFIRQDDLERKITDYLRTLPTFDEHADIDSEVVLKAIESQHGILVERAWHIYSFSHLTFQEYYTAKYISENATERILDNLVRHVNDDRWHEVLLIVASLLENADFFFEAFSTSLRISVGSALTSVLSWVGKKAMREGKSDYKARCQILALSLCLGHAADKTIGPFYDFDSEKIQSVLDLILVLDPSINRQEIRELAETLFQAFTCVLARTRILSPTIFLDFKDHIARAIGICQQLELVNLKEQLENIIPPPEHTRRQGWQLFAATFKSTILDDWGINQFLNVNNTQMMQFETYLRASILYIDCLNLACVSNRKDLEDHLLLSPLSAAGRLIK